MTRLKSTSVVSCLELATIYDFHVNSTLGQLSPALLQQRDVCLKVALDLR